MGLISQGELRVLERALRPRGILIDAGAHSGEWARAAVERCATCIVHAFEPWPRTYPELVRTALDFPGRIVANPTALSENVGRQVMYGYAGRPDLNGLARRSTVEAALGLGEPDTVEVGCTTVDVYCGQQDVRGIAMMKVDVEGHELAVLRGARRMLHEQAVDVVQFEYGGTYLDAGVRLADVWALLVELGFAMFRIEPEELVRLSYVPAEDYGYSLFVALSPAALLAV